MSSTDYPLVTREEEEASGEQFLTSLAGSDEAGFFEAWLAKDGIGSGGCK